MKNSLKFIIALAFISSSSVTIAQSGKKLKLKTEFDTASYMIGMTIGTSLAGLPGNKEINTKLVHRGIEDMLAGDTVFSTDKLQAFMGDFMKKQQEAAAQEAKKEQVAFLEKNKAKDSIQVTESGLQYKIINEGIGNKPAATDKVKVHYTGKLIDGSVFDSSVERGEPAEFGLNQVIPGWTEGLQLMSVGSKYILYIPSELGYGPQGAGQAIPPYSTLMFEIELLEIVTGE